jgi:YVTN family beta-propeller protein
MEVLILVMAIHYSFQVINTVIKINMKNLKLSLAILMGITIFFSACSKDNTSNDTNKVAMNFDAAYVVNGESNSISVINLSANKVDTTFTLPMFQADQGMGMMGSGTVNMWPHHISLSPDKSKIAVSFPGSNLNGGAGMMLSSFTSGSMMGNNTIQGKILILDAVTGKILKELTLDGMAYNAVFSPDGKEIWSALMMTSGKVNVFDATSYALMNTIVVGQMPSEVSFSEDGKKVYVANGMSNTVTVIDAATKQVLENAAVGNYPVGAWPGMGGMMYVDNEKDHSIGMMNGTTNMMTGSVQLGYVPGMVASNTMMNQMWVSDPNGGKVQMWTNTNNGYVMGGTVTVGNGASSMAFNKSGTTCYVTNQNDGTVSVVNVTTLNEMMKIKVGSKPNGIVIRYN